MSPRESLSPEDLATVLTTYAQLLRSHQEAINRLNVYPVPDGDTGTNMALTIETVVREIENLDSVTMANLCAAVSHGSLMGARGNSGVILSQLLRGLMEKFKTETVVTSKVLADALEHADTLARQAVVRPLEGTILSVARAAALGAKEATSLTELVELARQFATTALAKTPDQLAVLKQAGVVDSGGTGLVLFFDSLCFVVNGDALPIPPDLSTIAVNLDTVQPNREDDVSGLRYEVMYLLDADDNKMAAFRDVWSGIGDSIVIVGGEGLYNCHIHTNDIGASIEAAIDAGRPREIRVTDLAEQVIEESWVREHASDSVDSDEPAPPTSVVAVVVGDGIGRIFRSLGVRVLVKGGQTMNPSTAELVEAVLATGSSEVVLLPNNKNIRPVAEQVAALVDIPVTVVPTNSAVEGFGALLAYDPAASAHENQASMSASFEHIVTGEVTRAVRATATEVGDVKEGDWIGLGPTGVLSFGDSVPVAAIELLERLVQPHHELLTVIEGEGSTPAATRRISEFVRDEFAHVTVEVHHGGQPLYPYLFGIE